MESRLGRCSLLSSTQLFDSPTPSIGHWLSKAKSGSSDAVEQLLVHCRNYLLLVANRELDADLKGKFGASDLVQESLLEAHRDFDQFEGTSEADILAWLRKILLNNLGEQRKRFKGTQKRDVGREQSLEHEITVSRCNGVHTSDSSLIGKLILNERQEALERAIANLPLQYRDALLMRHREGCSFEEIGQRTDRSPDAARKLWARAVEYLKQNLRSYLTHDSR